MEDEIADYKTWTHDSTKVLIDLYKSYRNKVGTFEVRNMKKLWEVIATEIKRQINISVTASNCENRWRVIERNYKKYVDNNNKTGRGRKDFEYAKEMDEIYGKKRNIHPEILLSASATVGAERGDNYLEFPPNVIENLETASPQTLLIDVDENVRIEEGFQNNISQTPVTSKSKMPQRPKVTSKKNRADILDMIRKDRLKYQAENLSLKKATAERKLLIEERKLEEKIRKNNLIEERNRILKMYLEKQINLPPFI